MRPSLTILGAALLACSGGVQPRAIGETIDLRQYLADSLRLIAPDPNDTAFHQRLLVGPDSAAVEVRWRAARHDGGRYLTEVSALLVAVAPYDSLTAGDVSDVVNVGSKTMPIESAKVRIGWFKLSGRAGAVEFSFDAAGKHLVGRSSTR